ncbi:MAG: NADPH:quinone oxidoreductase family protein [Alphaproteobacteria bacterium]|nr:NADPH:quinone oxidoreductase family protein [Alphaproteobacteria bacterium]
MRAIVCGAWGKVETLELGELPAPVPKAGEVLIRVHAAGVNYADAIMVGGTYQTKPDFPFSPGLEAAGEIMAVGPGVERARIGERVMAILNHGGFAEQVTARAHEAYPLPQAMDYATAAGFLTAYVSSHVAIRWQGRLEAGESMLVLGAAGGVGLTAVEIGKAMGATVIAGASSAAKLAIAKEHGADHLIDYGRQDLKDEVERLTGGEGVDVCYDPVGGPLFDKALSSLAWGGRILLIGFVAGVPQIPANRLLVKHRAALGSSLRYFRHNRPDQLKASVDELLVWYEAGKLRPLISAQFELARTVEAIRVLTERRVVGKVVVTL